jgi:transcriptional regulator with PAS, ATPase and Fis domain
VQNCAALQEQLLESEIFGHVKGAFTGAIKNKPGLFEVADGGTFFLDELGEMSQALQVKLLRVLQDGSFVPVGGTETKKVSVRIVAATNRDLEKMVKAGTFREDLFYRLNVVRIKLPALRDRKKDIPELITSFLVNFCKRHSKPNKTIQAEALQQLVNYDWPGNIRELQNEIERLVILSGNNALITTEKLSSHIRTNINEANTAQANDRSGLLAEAVANLEKDMISKALIKFSGNKSEAARQLGMSRSNFIAKVKLYSLDAL